MTDPEIPGDPPYYSTTNPQNQGGQGNYHTDPNCGNLQRSNGAYERTARYIEWKNLKPCEGCVGGTQK